MPECVPVDITVHVHKGLTSAPTVFPSHTLPYVLRQTISPNLELANLARLLAGKSSRGFSDLYLLALGL